MVRKLFLSLWALTHGVVRDVHVVISTDSFVSQATREVGTNGVYGQILNEKVRDFIFIVADCCKGHTPSRHRSISF